jgi:hypothetical protein
VQRPNHPGDNRTTTRGVPIASPIGAATSVEIGSASSEWEKKDDDWAPLVSEGPGTGVRSSQIGPRRELSGVGRGMVIRPTRHFMFSSSNFLIFLSYFKFKGSNQI